MILQEKDQRIQNLEQQLEYKINALNQEKQEMLNKKQDEFKEKEREFQSIQDAKEEELNELLVKISMLESKESADDSGDMSNQLLDLVRRNQQLF